VAKHGGTHLFLCEGAEVLPRWREAFRGAVAHAPAAAAGLPEAGQAVLLWFRLRQGEAPAVQLERLDPALRDLPLVVLSDLPDDEEALEAFAAGARGYVNTHATAPILKQVASVVGQGGLWIGTNLMRRLLTATSQLPPVLPDADGWAQRLTGREQQVARAVAGGASNKEVARQLGITERTVKAHVTSIFEKLQVRDRLQLSLVVNGRARPA
jgi:DNA-binding NarL/FixJ family response regulator